MRIKFNLEFKKKKNRGAGKGGAITLSLMLVSTGKKTNEGALYLPHGFRRKKQKNFFKTPPKFLRGTAGFHFYLFGFQNFPGIGLGGEMALKSLMGTPPKFFTLSKICFNFFLKKTVCGFFGWSRLFFFFFSPEGNPIFSLGGEITGFFQYLFLYFFCHIIGRGLGVFFCCCLNPHIYNWGIWRKGGGEKGGSTGIKRNFFFFFRGFLKGWGFFPTFFFSFFFQFYLFIFGHILFLKPMENFLLT